jgi:hypothetical protein
LSSAELGVPDTRFDGSQLDGWKDRCWVGAIFGTLVCVQDGPDDGTLKLGISDGELIGSILEISFGDIEGRKTTDGNMLLKVGKMVGIAFGWQEGISDSTQLGNKIGFWLCSIDGVMDGCLFSVFVGALDNEDGDRLDTQLGTKLEGIIVGVIDGITNADTLG